MLAHAPSDQLSVQGFAQVLPACRVFSPALRHSTVRAPLHAARTCVGAPVTRNSREALAPRFGQDLQEDTSTNRAPAERGV